MEQGKNPGARGNVIKEQGAGSKEKWKRSKENVKKEQGAKRLQEQGTKGEIVQAV